MKVIIAGSRDGFVAKNVFEAVDESPFVGKITEVVSGTARGVDKDGEYYAACHGLPIKRFPANWEEHGKWAGFKRNRDMAFYADALVAVWDGKSKGTKHMIDTMRSMGKPVYVYIR